MSYLYYGIIIIYPLIAAVSAKLTIAEITGWARAIKQAYYLFFGFLLLYSAIMFIGLAIIRIFPPPLLSFAIFSIGYFAIFILRTYIYVEAHDMFKPQEKGIVL